MIKMMKKKSQKCLLMLLLGIMLNATVLVVFAAHYVDENDSPAAGNCCSGCRERSNACIPKCDGSADVLKCLYGCKEAIDGCIAPCGGCAHEYGTCYDVCDSIDSLCVEAKPEAAYCREQYYRCFLECDESGGES